MEIKSIRTGRYKRLVILLLILIQSGFSLVSQEEVSRLLEAEWKQGIFENQRFTLKVITPYPGKMPVSIMDPQWPEGIQKVSGPYTAQRTIEREDGTFGTVLQVIYTLRSQSSGIFRIPPMTVLPRGGRSEYSGNLSPLSTEELFIPVLRNDEKHLNYPLQLSWENLPDEIYAGQSVPLVLIMNNLEEIDLPESVQLSSPGGAILEDAEGLGDIGFTGMRDTTLFNVPMSSWILTPSREGAVTLPAAVVSISGVTRRTERQTIPVLALPDRVEPSGAVGRFSINYSLSAETVTPGSSLSLTVRMEGEGNLNFLNMPEPVIPEGLSYSVKEFPDFFPSREGYQGVREAVYTFRPESLEHYEIAFPPYSVLDPRSGRIDTTEEAVLAFDVSGDILDSEKAGKERFSLMALSDSRAARGWTLYRIPLLYLSFLPGIFFFTLMAVFKRFKPALIPTIFLSLLLLSASAAQKAPESWGQEAQVLFDQSSYADALALYDAHRAVWQKNGTFLYNTGVLEFLSGRKAPGVADMRRAQNLLPMNSRIHQTLEAMEELMNLKNQHNQFILIHPDFLFLILILVFNSAMLSLGYSVIQHKPLPVLLFLFFSLMTIAAGGELLRTAWLLDRPLAVINQDSVVKKVPEEIGSDWLNLEEGTTVSFVKQEGDYSLVVTAFGLEGWMRYDNLIFLKGEEP